MPKGRVKGFKVGMSYGYSDAYLRKELGKKYEAIVSGGEEGLNDALYESGESLLRRELSRREYNEYTGRLTNSYVATIVRFGKVKKGKFKKRIITTDDVIGYMPQQTIHQGKRGGRYVYMSRAPRHKYSKGKSNNEYSTIRWEERYKRYLKWWEPNNQGSYAGSPYVASNTVLSPRAGQYSSVNGDRYMSGTIIVQNVAPYAAMVHKKWRVFSSATIRHISTHATTMIRKAVIKRFNQR